MTHRNQFWKIIRLRTTIYFFKQNDKVKAHGYKPNIWPLKWVWSSTKHKLKTRVNNQFWNWN